MKIENFSVINRNYGHWDIVTDKSRAFRLRGGPGKYIVIDEREINVKKDDIKADENRQLN